MENSDDPPDPDGKECSYIIDSIRYVAGYSIGNHPGGAVEKAGEGCSMHLSFKHDSLKITFKVNERFTLNGKDSGKQHVMVQYQGREVFKAAEPKKGALEGRLVEAKGGRIFKILNFEDGSEWREKLEHYKEEIKMRIAG